jgi:hypothetical protein
MNVPAVIKMPLSSVENMKMELAWLFADLFDQYWAIREELERLKHRLQFDDFSEPEPYFDPLRTIGKYQ